MANKVIVGNWKMHCSVQEAKDLVHNMRSDLESICEAKIVICPPFTALVPVSEMLRDSKISIGAQNMHYETHGAFTGEISTVMLSELCEFVIVGHSERRQLFGETDHIVNKKLKTALEANISPIMCVGETFQERKIGMTDSILKNQLIKGLDGIKCPYSLIIAYEPIWAIGTGVSATPNDAEITMSKIRNFLVSKYGKEFASEIPLLYGGSVTAINVSGFIDKMNIDGVLVGGASLKPDSFSDLANKAVLLNN